jgi:hypothetical protein
VVLAGGLDMQQGCKNKSCLFRFCSYIAGNYIHMKKTFTPERRLEIYKEALEKDLDPGLCVVIGRICYGRYFDSPWCDWQGMREYFPEFIRCRLGSGEWFSPTQRREILEFAIAEVTELINSKACPTSSTP